MCQGTFVWKKCFYTMCSVRLIFSIAVEKCNGRRNLLHSWKNMVVKGTCCIQVTICLDDISSSKKQYSCRTIQYVEKCNTTFNEAQPSYSVSCMPIFSGTSLLQTNRQGLPLSKKQYSCRNIQDVER